jgi:nucleotide-binding universal stress UspA family protein
VTADASRRKRTCRPPQSGTRRGGRVPREGEDSVRWTRFDGRANRRGNSNRESDTLSRYLALDWDQNQLHLIEATVRGRSVAVRKAAVWPEARTPNPANAEELGQFLRERLKEAGITPAPVLACVGRDRVIVKEVRYPQVPDVEEPAIVRFQTVKELTDAAEDVIIDYAVSGTNGNGERKASALVVRREVLATYQKLAQAAGLKLQALTPRLVGVAACVRQVIGKTVVTPPPEPADGVIAVVVVGEKTAELSVLRDLTFLLARSVPVGDNLARNLRHNLAVHAGQAPQSPIVAVYVAGKGAGELRERLSELVEIPVHTFDPFAGSEARELPTGNRGTFSGAVGLLYANAAGPLAINFVSPRQPKPPKNPNLRLYRVAIIAFVTLVVGGLALGRFAIALKSAEADRLEAARTKTTEDLTKAKANGKRLKALDDWDVPVWGDEMYELTARINDVNALRVTSIHVEPVGRSGSSKFAGRMTIKGRLLDKKNPRKPLDDLIAAFRREGYYSAQAPNVENDTFTLIVNVERRPPGEYKARLVGERDGPAKLPEKSDKDRSKTKDRTKTSEKDKAEEKDRGDKTKAKAK